MQWDVFDEKEPRGGTRGSDVSYLALPVRLEVSLTGAPWEFRARLVELGSDYCILTLLSPCAPALRRDATATLYIGTLGPGEVVFDAIITDLLPRHTGMTFRCAIHHRRVNPAPSSTQAPARRDERSHSA
ncbi:MAG TPA: hypothetical protein VFE42_25055 [Chloroflexota bacterium]|nr:hypothetical protein [Chloroflexota bacterium]